MEQDFRDMSIYVNFKEEHKIKGREISENDPYGEENWES